MEIVLKRCDKAALTRVKELYESSFPVEERRCWNDFSRLACQDGDGFKLLAVETSNRFAGFVTLWEFDDFTYIEHFAIEPSFRGKGIGSRVLGMITSQSGKPVILEVEPQSTGRTAERRIRFYLRNGFVSRTDFAYLQPPYSPGLPPVEMMLMTSGGKIDLKEASALIRHKVYGVHGKE